MSKSKRRATRILWMMVFVLALSVVYPSSAQSSLGFQITAKRLPVGYSTVEPTPNVTVVTSPGGAFSAQMPANYVTDRAVASDLGDSLAFGDSATTEQAIVNAMARNGLWDRTFAGVGGVIIQPVLESLPGKNMGILVDPLMRAIVRAVEGSRITIVHQPQAHTFAGVYTGQLLELNAGFVGIFYWHQQIMIAMIFSDDVSAHRSEMTAILDSIRITGSDDTQPTPSPTDTPTPLELPTVRSSDGRLSLALPSSWTVLDHIADQNILAYGDSVSAAQSRLYAANPQLAAQQAISGNGGLIILYPMAQFGIDPQNPDLNPLMTRVLSSLSGYQIEQPAEPLPGGGVIAVISGAERGYLALIPFGDQIAYMTATGTRASFIANAPLLRSILTSVHVPALIPTATANATATATPSATPSATPTATASATPSATLTATPSATPSATPTTTASATPGAAVTTTPKGPKGGRP